LGPRPQRWAFWIVKSGSEGPKSGSEAVRARVSYPPSPLRPDLRALLFDMDGLLVDSEPLWARVEADFARVRGGDFTAAHAEQCVGRGLERTLLLMHEAFGFPVDLPRDAAEIVSGFIARAGELALKPGALALLDAAEGVVPVALGSSSARRLVLSVLDAVGLGSRFDAVVCGDDVARTKPAPDIFLECARRLGVDPEACVVLEDSLAGVEAGRAARARVIAVPERRPFDLRIAELADHVVGDLLEARGLLSLSLAPSR
jgi:beta-phosphoglucomutase-like phosphatase (HAD superfamily)